MANLDQPVRVRLLGHIGERTEVSAPAAGPLLPGAPAIFDEDGKAAPASAAAAETARAYGINATSTVNQANITAQIVHRGKVVLYDVAGANVLDGLDYGAIVYLSDDDGLLADAPGTVEIEIGQVVPVWMSNPPEKALEIDIRSIEPAPAPPPPP